MAKDLGPPGGRDGEGRATPSPATVEVEPPPSSPPHPQDNRAHRQGSPETGMWAEPDVVTDLDADEARALTDQIKADAETLWDNIATAYTRRAWAALDYSSWDEYCIREFGSSRLRLPREERPEMVASLRQSGLSIRAIASATGIDKNTVQADLTQVSEIHTPDPVDEDALTEELIAAEPRAPVIGIDGKRYRPQRKPAPKPGRTPTQGSGCGTVSAFTVERRQPEPTPTQRRSDDNEIKFPVVLRSILRDLDALMGFAKALNPDAKRKVIDKHQVDLVDCAAKLVAINHELSEPEQEPATDQKPTDAS